MARLLFGLLLFATVIAQSTFLPRLNPLPVTPDLVLVLLFIWAALHSVRESLFWVFFTGIVLDVLGIDPLGANGLALLILVVVSHPLRIRPWHFNMTSVMLLIFLATFVHGVMLAMLRGIGPDMGQIAFRAVLHVVVVPVIFLFMRMIGR